MNFNVNLVPADYQLVYTTKLKYYPILLNNRRSKSVHCVSNLNNQCELFDDYQINCKSDLKLIKNNFQSKDYFCRAIYSNNSSTQLKLSSLIQILNLEKHSQLIKTASTSTISSQKLKRAHRMPSNSNNGKKEKIQNESTFNVQNSSTRPSNSPTRITDTDAIQLLAEDVESKLEALLRTFIQEEKLRQETRHNNLIGKRSASLNSLNTNFVDSYNELLNTTYSPVSKRLNNNKQQLESKKTNSKDYEYILNQVPSSYQKQNLINNRSLSPSRKLAKNQASCQQFLNSNSVNNHIHLFNNNSSLSSSIVNSNKIYQKSKSDIKQTARSNSPSPSSSSHLQLKQSNFIVNNQQQSNLNLYNQKQQQSNKFLNRMYPNNLFSNSNNSASHFGRSKDDSHIKQVVVYNLTKDALNGKIQKKPIVLESAKSMNGTLNNTNLKYTSKHKTNSIAANIVIPTNVNNNITTNVNKIININNNNPQQTGSIKSKSVKTRINSPNQVGRDIEIVNENNKLINKSSTPVKFININTNDNLITNQILNSNNKIIKSSFKTNNFLNENLNASGLECTVLKDHNNNLNSVGSNVNTDGGGVGGNFSNNESSNSERKLVPKLISKNSNSTSGERNNRNKTNLLRLKNYNTQSTINSFNTNGDLKNASHNDLTTPTMDSDFVTMNSTKSIINSNKSTDLLNSTSISLNSLLCERDRIINSREQINKHTINSISNDKKNQSLMFSGDVNNNYISSKKISTNEHTSNVLNSSDSSTKNSINRVLPLSSTKRKVLIDKFSPFSIVNEARQKWEENLNKSNGWLKNSNNSFVNCDLNDDYQKLELDSYLNEYNNLDCLHDDNKYFDFCINDNSYYQSSNDSNDSSNKSNPTFSMLPHNKYDELQNSPSLPNITNTNSLTIQSSSMRPPLTLASALYSNSQTSQTSNSQNNRQNNLKLFLSKGSVAERVMLFEKHPQLKQIEETEAAHRKDELTGQQFRLHSKLQVPYSSWRDKNKKEVVNLATSFEQNLKGKSSKPNSNISSENKIPRFYFPYGKPETNLQYLETINKKIIELFKHFKDGICYRKNISELCKTSNLPIYWKEPLFLMVSQGNNHITYDMYMKFWKKLTSTYHDEPSKFFYILSKGKRNYLLPEDFIPMVQDVIDTHPGLLFLKFAFEFHSRYVHTVIARIYYTVNRSWSGKINLSELRKSNFLQIVKLLQEEDDINQITDYFSYEHFYVIYCKFWSLDKDHDLIIDKYDLSRYNGGAISSRMIDRIFSGAVIQGKSKSIKQMTYQEFVYFLISEEDKRNETSIEYWFRCLDLDGDGYLSLYELEYFYEEQVNRMKTIGIEALPFNDCICQMLDMINPGKETKISLGDLKKCSMTHIFLDTFFNLHKYLLHEQKDPFANKDDQTQSDWERFAAEEYEILVTEESSQNQNITSENDEPNIQNHKLDKYPLTSYIEDPDYEYLDEDLKDQQVGNYYLNEDEKNINLKLYNKYKIENQEYEDFFSTSNEDDYDYISTTEEDYFY